jgi:nucleoside-diphosphate-sugar epimerase
MDSPLPSYRDREVLVTGGCGAVGSRLTLALIEAGARVTVLDDLSGGVRWLLPDEPNLRVLVGDVLDPGALAAAFEPRPQVVFHLAAFFANLRSLEDPERDLLVNGLGTIRVLEAARRHHAVRVVHAASGGSAATKGAPLPLREDDGAGRHSTPYQVSKGAGERYALCWAERHGLPVAVVRLFQSYGPGELPGRYRNVVANFLWSAMQGEPLLVTGDGSETRDFTWVGDTVDGLARAGVVAEAVGQVLHIASARETRVDELAALINTVTGSRAGTREAARRDWDGVDRLVASVDRAWRVLGYQPRMPLVDGLRDTLAWMRHHEGQIREHLARGG